MKHSILKSFMKIHVPKNVSTEWKMKSNLFPTSFPYLKKCFKVFQKSVNKNLIWIFLWPMIGALRVKMNGENGETFSWLGILYFLANVRMWICNVNLCDHPMWYFVFGSLIKTFVNLMLLSNVSRVQNIQRIQNMKKKRIILFKLS